MHEPLVSVIMPVYNARATLMQAVESVMAQTIGFENIELLLIDDHSTDGSADIIDSLAQKHANVVALQTPQNSGTPALPRNIGIENATAPYVMFIDNDDAFFPNACKALYEAAEASGTDLVTGDVALMNPFDLTPEEREKVLFYSDDCPTGTLSLDGSDSVAVVMATRNHWCKIFKREIIEKFNVRNFPGYLAEDFAFLLQYITYCDTITHIAEPIYQYRVRKESLSYEPDAKFYCRLPQSYDFSMQQAERHGLGKRYVHLFHTVCDMCESYFDQFLDSKTLTEADYADILSVWKNMLCYIPQYGGHFHSAYCKILSDDYKRGEDQQALFHFLTLKELYLQRKQELDSIFSSTTYKLASRLASIKEKLLRR